MYKASLKKKNPPDNATYKTPDLYLSAFLKSKGIILQNIEKENNRVFFIFQDDGNIQDLINGYFNDSDTPVLRYKAALRDLRSLIFNYPNSMRAKENQDG